VEDWRPNVLMVAMWLAARRGHYRGRGEEWLAYSTEELKHVISDRQHEDVLRSEAFAQNFWYSLKYWERLRPWGTPAWKRHHEAIQRVDDPLEYIRPYVNNPHL